MLTELFLKLPRSLAKQHGKLTSDTDFQTVKSTVHGRKQIQDAMFRASKLYATGTFHGKNEHGRLVLNALNKTPSLNMFQRSTDMMIASMQNSKLC